jgi:hypothetical protein
MSLQFNTGSKGIIQQIERQLGLGVGYISGDSTRLAEWTADINLALDKVFHIIFNADGRWQFDDSNHTDYPIITTNIVSAQRDYSFTVDEDSHLILAIDRVFYRSSTTNPYYELFPIDVQTDSENDISTFVDGLNTQGQPTRYDKTANGIFLDMVPPDNVTSGLKIYISREGSYFLTSDTTKSPGFGGLYHEYLILEPAYRYARANNLAVREALKRDMLEMEKVITDYYSRRDGHDRPVMFPEPINYE